MWSNSSDGYDILLRQVVESDSSMYHKMFPGNLKCPKTAIFALMSTVFVLTRHQFCVPKRPFCDQFSDIFEGFAASSIHMYRPQILLVAVQARLEAFF